MRISDWSSDVCSSDLVLEPDAVMDRSGIGQGRVSIRLADGDIGDAICIGLKHRKNTFRRKPMNSCHHRRFNQSRESERSEEHTSELQSLMRISYAVFCLKKKKTNNISKQLTYRIDNNHV